jgi:hypothetical protein
MNLLIFYKGLFNFDHLEYEIDRIENKVEEPSMLFYTFNFYFYLFIVFFN